MPNLSMKALKDSHCSCLML